MVVRRDSGPAHDPERALKVLAAELKLGVFAPDLGEVRHVLVVNLDGLLKDGTCGLRVTTVLVEAGKVRPELMQFSMGLLRVDGLDSLGVGLNDFLLVVLPERNTLLPLH